jgi:tRNA pseudouridine55 synthase
MQGILLVNKPIGWTSFDVVALVRKIIAIEQKVKPAQIKVGHTGTLDPLAEGLLVLLIGKKYTRLAEKFTKLDKEYLANIKLGEVTDSGDSETEPKFYSSYQPSKQEIEETLKKFIGQSNQKPPIYSAIKVNGQRAYKAARSGQKIELKPRQITIYEIKLLEYRYPVLNIKAKVSSGTYIRSLVEDIGKNLGSGGYMTGLKRTEVGEFKLSDSISADDINYQKINSNLFFV